MVEVLDTICQVVIPIFSGLGVYFVNRKDKYMRYGCVFGLLGQPFWHYTLFVNEQWGLLALSSFFTFQWGKGFYHHWLKKDVVVLSQTKTDEQTADQPKILKNLPLIKSPMGGLFLTQFLMLQKEIDDMVKGRPNKIPKDKRARWTLEYTRAMKHEINELEDWLPWKFWSEKQQSRPIDEMELKYEMIDIFHFLLSMFLIWEMDAEEVSTLYLTKHAENIRRQQSGY